MFTFGIFTTHLPYVAFVVFYAYFLLFGINKAVDGEIESEQKIVFADSHFVYHGNDISDDCCSFYDFLQVEENTYSENAIFKRKWKHRSAISPQSYQLILVNSLFSRPPPIV